MSEIAVRHTREECFAHTNDWKNLMMVTSSICSKMVLLN